MLIELTYFGIRGFINLLYVNVLEELKNDGAY